MSYLENVMYVGESINVQISIDNTHNPTHVKDVLVALVQNMFVTANCGATRTFRRVRKTIHSDGAAPNSPNAYNLILQINP
jgi:hypothetical protein